MMVAHRDWGHFVDRHWQKKGGQGYLYHVWIEESESISDLVSDLELVQLSGIGLVWAAMDGLPRLLAQPWTSKNSRSLQ